VFVPEESDPIHFAKDSPAKFLLMRLRDEAHRFANRHRRTRASKTLTASALDRIPSIGPLTRRTLLQEFGSVDAIRRASDDALQKFVSEEQLRGIREML
jgi:excinuclease ABC subunit C